MKNRQVRGLFAVGGGIALTVAMFGAVAWACVPSARVTLSPTSGAVGTDIGVTGSSFDASATEVNVWWGAVGTAGTKLATTTVAADRTISVSFKVPESVGGNHIVSVTQHRADGTSIGNPTNATFKVLAPGTTAQAPNLQGAAQDADGAAGLAPATVETPAPAPAPATSTAAAPARTTTQSRTAAPAPARTAQPAPAAAAQPAPAAAPAPAPAAETPAPAPAVETPAQTFDPAPVTPVEGAAAERPSRSDTPLATLIALAILSLGFIGTGTAIFMNERKRVRARA